VTRLKESIEVPIAMHCHATTGLSTATYQKAIDAGIDILDTSISSMSMTYGHTATETIVSIVEGTERDSGLALPAFTDIASYFRDVRKKYAQFEGSLKGVDARILIAQVPGGMLTNMESQLKEQGAEDRMDEVLLEIPKVREDLGFIPLVTPTSQIVGTQSVINVITGERYKNISKETAGVLKGEYGATAAPVNKELQLRVLNGKEPIKCRPADLIENELAALTTELTDIAKKESIQTADDLVDDVLIYALFPQIGLKFLKNRNNPDAFEPRPGHTPQVITSNSVSPKVLTTSTSAYSVRVDGQVFEVEVAQSGELTNVQAASDSSPQLQEAKANSETGQALKSPLAGNIFKVLVKEGSVVTSGDVVIIMEAMKMETEIRASNSGVVSNISTKEGDAVQTGQPLLVIG
jgi:oxaloacetate decarboxylase alpha subunit